MPSLRSLLSSVSVGAGTFFSQIPFQNHQASTPNAQYSAFSLAPTCPIDTPVSCQASPVGADSCCFISPGGQLLQTQFWDAKPAIGPSDSWTVHGLWPDLCDGDEDFSCDFAPAYSSITSIISEADPDLFDFMSQYWLPNNGAAERFWQHEWDKHGRCVNTLSPDCYGDGYQPGMEVVDYFQRTVSLFKTLDTFAALEKAGIVPSTSTTYSRAEILRALNAVTGHRVVIGCEGGALNQVWYSYNVKGNIQTGEFLPTDPVGRKQPHCPTKGIKYLPK